MNTEILLTSLAAQYENLESLIESLQNQKTAIIKNDYALLDKEVLSEQKILNEMEKEELVREKVVKEIANELAIEMTKYSIDELLMNAQIQLGQDFKKIQTLRTMIKAKLETLLNLNTQLKNVLDFSRNLIRETMLMVAKQNKNVIVNKRV